MVTQNVVIHILCYIYSPCSYLFSIRNALFCKMFYKKGWEVNLVYGFDLARSILDIVIL